MTKLLCVKETAVSPPFTLQVFAVGLLQTSGVPGAVGGSKGRVTSSTLSSGTFHAVEVMHDEQHMPVDGMSEVLEIVNSRLAHCGPVATEGFVLRARGRQKTV